MISFTIVSNVLGALAFLFLAGLLLLSPERRAVGRWLIVASAVTAAWFAFSAAGAALDDPDRIAGLLILFFELARDAVWVLFIALLLKRLVADVHRRTLNIVANGTALMLACLAGLAVLQDFTAFGTSIDAATTRKVSLIASLLVALIGLTLTEQLYRHTARGARWALKHLCFGLGLMFTFDFYLYAEAVLFNRIDEAVWSARGLVNAVAVPMMTISASRNRDWDLKIFVSRQIVFNSATLLAAGVYLMAMALAGYYVQLFGGEWGRALKIGFFAAALLVLVSLFVSTQLRSRMRIFITRHFYRNKYEYGEQWLKFTQALSATALEPEALNTTILAAVCDIIDSPGGVIYQRTANGDFAVAAHVHLYENCSEVIAGAGDFILLLEEDAAVWDLAPAAELDAARRAALPAHLADLPALSLIVPVLHGTEMIALLLLAQPRGMAVIDWEDRNLLRTVSRQAASYLALMRATEALSEARQFETFNRLSAFLVHDLKNVVAQLSLLLSNAERHRDNPEFIADAFNTVGAAVERMNRMLAGLRQMQVDVASGDIADLLALATEAVRRKADHVPRPVLAPGAAEGLWVRVGSERLLAVLEHLVQNAVDATDAAGTVTLALRREGDFAELTVADTGCGMDKDFIARRLFKPFDTTKGKAGMGIGAYESRHVITSFGGTLSVASEPDVGTTFTIRLPLADSGESLSAGLRGAEA